MYFTAPFVVFATLANTLVSALPAVVVTDAAAICDQPTLNAVVNTWSTQDFIRKNTDNPLKKSPIFWSRSTGGVSVLADAEKCGTKVVPQGYTVGMMMCEHRPAFTMPQNGITDAAARATATQLWDTASRAFAQNTTVNPDGTWAKVDFPALQANKLVTSVLKIDPKTCATMCYWLCNKGSESECKGLLKCANAP